jgi:hypothetical protein
MRQKIARNTVNTDQHRSSAAKHLKLAHEEGSTPPQSENVWPRVNQDLGESQSKDSIGEGGRCHDFFQLHNETGS